MLLLTLPLQQQMLNDNFLQSVTSLICNKTGIKIRPEDHSSLLKKIRRRVQSLKLKDELEYLELLTSRSRESKAEWDNLIGLITTGESYFFRDRGQIKLIQEHLLPDLIEKRQAQRTLNILSAGCSTGEEVYSLAIIIKENFPELDNWDVNLVGIDLNREAINKALQGIYPDWSFRGVENRYRLAYFRRQKAGWQIINSLKHRVSFRQCNLVEDDLYFFTSGAIDLIICRNVFIYFDRDKISLVLRKFIDLLRAGGYLLTGHTEMQEQDTTPLIALSYAESLVYQKPEDVPMQIGILNSPTPTVPLTNFKELGKQKLSEGLYHETIEYCTSWLNLNPQDEEAELFLAQAYANRGQYKEAEAVCYRVLEKNHLAVPFLHILAHIAEETGQKAEAKEYLRRSILIDPNFVPAYLDLIALHLSDQEYSTAAKLLFTIKSMSNSQLIHYQAQVYTIENLIKNFCADRG